MNNNNNNNKKSKKNELNIHINTINGRANTLA